MTRIRHSLLLTLVLLAGCGGEEQREEIAYSTVREEVPTRIVVVQDDGKKARRVSGAKFRANPVLPKWSPDGQRIAFVRANPAGGPEAFQTYVVNADGSGERELGEGTLPVWTNDGRFVVVERPKAPPQSSTIQVLSLESGSRGGQLAVGSAPAVSHRGNRVAFVRYTYRRRPNGDVITTSSSLYTISLDGTGLRRVARTTQRDVRWAQPNWLPDDSAVAVLQRRPGGAVGGPLLTFTPSGRRRQIVPSVGETYDWSPKGDLVAYSEGDILFIIRPDGTEVESYGESNAIDIEWSPDGRKVAFTKQESIETSPLVGAYLIDLDEDKRSRFVVADGFAAFLDWRPKPPD